MFSYNGERRGIKVYFGLMDINNNDVDKFLSRYSIELSEITQRKIKQSGLMIRTSDQIFNQVIGVLQKNNDGSDENSLRDEFKLTLKRIINYWLRVENQV